MCVGYQMLDSYNHLISNKRDWNNCFNTNALKIRKASQE